MHECMYVCIHVNYVYAIKTVHIQIAHSLTEADTNGARKTDALTRHNVRWLLMCISTSVYVCAHTCACKCAVYYICTYTHTH